MFSTDFRKKNTHMSNVTKIRRVGAELFHADWRTDRHDETISRFLGGNFANAPKNRRTSLSEK